MKKLLKKVRLSSAHIYKNTIQPPHTRAAPLPLYPSSPRLSSSLLFSPLLSSSPRRSSRVSSHLGEGAAFGGGHDPDSTRVGGDLDTHFLGCVQICVCVCNRGDRGLQREGA